MSQEFMGHLPGPVVESWQVEVWEAAAAQELAAWVGAWAPGAFLQG